jgi:uncharacterized protein YndB with AHSA1/START domain
MEDSVTQTITVSDVIPATPAEIYAAWLDSVAHAAMTGGGAAQASSEVGAEHSAWDGYISGMNLALYPGQRIEQSWRSTDFLAEDADSTLTVMLDPVEGGTMVTLVHASVPDHQTGYEQGWREWYLEPMKAYFAALAEPEDEPAPPPAVEPAPARKPAAKKPAAPRRAPAKKPAAARKANARRPAAAKPARNAAAGKATGKRVAARKTAAKPAPAKKAAARKPAAKRGAAKKTTRTAAVKKPAVKKRNAPKSGARRRGTKASGRRTRR